MALLQEELDAVRGGSITLAAKKTALTARELSTSNTRLLGAAKATKTLADATVQEGNRVSSTIDTFISEVENIVDYFAEGQLVTALELALTLESKAETLEEKAVTNATKTVDAATRIIDTIVLVRNEVLAVDDLVATASVTAVSVCSAAGVTVNPPAIVEVKFDKPTSAVDTALNLRTVLSKVTGAIQELTTSAEQVEVDTDVLVTLASGFRGVAEATLGIIHELVRTLTTTSTSTSTDINTARIALRNMRNSSGSQAVSASATGSAAQRTVQNVSATATTTKSIKSTATDVAKMATRSVGKLMAKYKPDLPFHVNRPIAKGDTVWPTPPGSELPKEARAIANHEPTVRIWNKSAKGHSLHVDDQDGVERMVMTDRTGSVLLFDAPVKMSENAANKEQRGSRSVLSGDQLERDKLRDNGGKIILQDLAHSQVELDSRDGFEKITITANDGTGGIQNGDNRQKVEIVSGMNRIMIESVKDGKIQARLTLDSNSGIITIEADTLLSILSPFISITGDHISLNGRVNINGDAVIAGRLTGGTT